MTDIEEEFEFDDWGIWMTTESVGYCWTCGFLGRFRIFNRLVARHLNKLAHA